VKQLLSFLIIILVAACSSSEETTNRIEDDSKGYVFDDVPPEDIFALETPKETSANFYVIQIAAFSTRERAELFAEKSRRDLNRGIAIIFNDDVNLFVVRLEEMFSSKIEAERVRANLWQMEEYNDAWIIPIKQKKE